MEQQQPTQVNPEDIFKQVFGGEGEKEKTQEHQLPEPPKAEIPTVEDVLNQAPTQTTPKTEEPKTEQPKTSEYSNKIKSFIEAGLLENVAITVDDEEVFLSDVDIQDEDTFKTILEGIKEEKEKQLKEKYISKEGLDETTEKLIEIRKAGGDITEIIKENVQAIDQLQHFKSILEDGDDKQKEQLAINILAQDLRQRGLKDSVINVQLQEFINDGVLEEEADKILSSHLSLHQQEIENKKQAELDRLEKEKEEFKAFKKNLSSTYKGWNIPENIQKVLVENATKADEYQVTNTDKLYFDVKTNNPELFAKLNFFLNNPQEFEKWISGKKVLETKKEVIKSSIRINTSKTKPMRDFNSNNLDDIAEQILNK